MREFHERELVSLLAYFTASGRLKSSLGLAAINQLAPSTGEKTAINELLETLASQEAEVFQMAAQDLKANRRREAERFHERRKTGIPNPECDPFLLGDLPLDAPLGWWRRRRQIEALKAALALAKDRRFARGQREIAPRTARALEQHYQTAAMEMPWPNEWDAHFPTQQVAKLQEQCQERDDELLEQLKPLQHHNGTSALESPEASTSVSLDANSPSILESLVEKYQSADSRDEQQKWLDRLCTYPKIEAAGVLADLFQESWAKERAELILTCRFGSRLTPGWDSWRSWLFHCEQLARQDLEEQTLLIENNVAEVLVLWCQGQSHVDPALVDRLEAWCNRKEGRLDAERFVQRWSKDVPAEEWNALLGIDVEVIQPKPTIQVNDLETTLVESRQETNVTRTSSAELPPKHKQKEHVPSHQERIEPAEVQAKGPALWQAHLQPFFAEHWYVVAGVVMAIAGSSLLAYYTWDKHWLVRYSLMPLLLGGFTTLLAWLGSWIESRDREFAATGAILRGAAISLLPMNFMVVALLSNDANVQSRTLVVPLMGLIYLAVFGWALSRWSRQVHPALTWLLGGTLLLLNSLVTLGPIARGLSHLGERNVRLVVGTGFYWGFAALAVSVIYFLKRVLTRELAEQKRIPWFFGATLVVTFLQVFLWVHGFLRQLPQPETYAPLIILAGGLVLLGERRGIELSERSQRYREESFVGYALVLLGTLMGAADPWTRIAAFALGGGVWLRQALARRESIHHWISLLFFMLSIASIGLLEGFPQPWFPALGVGAAVLMGLLGFIAGRLGHRDLNRACSGMQATTLLLSTVIAVLTQWHFHSEPWATGGCLLLIALGFAYLAWRENQLHYVRTAMMILALALPYVGCVDLEGQTLQGNVLVFGLAVLSFLWLGLNWCFSAKLIREARSTVLWFYGLLAVAGMILHVTIAGEDLRNVPWYRMEMSYFGPLLMSVALGFATWYSRSLVPAAMAAFIAIILFPELKARVQTTFTNVSWGSGLGSALSGLGLTGVCFGLRRARFLERLSEGDKFLGRTLFPFRRYDHTLFTWPILASILFLTIRTETWTLATHALAGSVGLKTAIALGITGITWTLLAVYFRHHSTASMATYIGCIAFLAAMLFGQPYLIDVPHWSYGVLLIGVFLQGLYFIYYFGLERRADWVSRVLSTPTSRALEWSSALLAIAGTVQLLLGADFQILGPLLGFVAAQLVWHGLDKSEQQSPTLITNSGLPANKGHVYGFLLFSLIGTSLLSYTATGAGPLISRLSVQQSLTTTLCFLLAVQLIHLFMELQPAKRGRIRSLSETFFLLSSLVVVGLVFWGMADIVTRQSLNLLPYVFLLGVAFITARGQASAVLALLTIFLAYVLIQVKLFDVTAMERQPSEQVLRLLLFPWRLALLSVGLAVLGTLGRQMALRFPRLVAGPFAQPFFRSDHAGWFYGTALGLATVSTVYQTFLPQFRDDQVQLLTPYLAAIAWGIVCWSWRLMLGHGISLLFLAVGNVHGVRVFGGEFLRSQGLSEIHLVALGLAATLIQLTLLRISVRRQMVTTFVNQAGLVLAGLVLALLSANYLTHPNLAEIPWLRFVISGAMAYLAGLYFRRAARSPVLGQHAYVDLSEGLYHFGVTLAIWCAVLLVPAFRQPEVALYALAIPMVYFHIRAELGFQSGQPFARRYRTSASVLGFVGLACYVFRPVVQLVFFPDESVMNANYYHSNSILVILLATLLLRLRGLGGTSWLAFYGGLALIAGSYFLLTWLPGLSPFESPVGAAWSAVGLAHFWTLVSHRRSPLRTAIQRMAAINGAHWFTLRRAWGICLLIATQLLVLWGILDWDRHPLMVAPLLVGAASVLIHLGAIRRSPTYFALARLQLVLALHADLLVPSYLQSQYVIWAILGLWAAYLVIDQTLKRLIDLPQQGTIAATFSALAFAHVLYHHPSSAVGLWGVGLGGLLAALTPRSSPMAESGEERGAAALLAFVPLWLVFFSQTDLRHQHASAVWEARTLFITIATLFAIGITARVFQARLAAGYLRRNTSQPRLFDQTLAWMAKSGSEINRITLWVSFLSVIFIHGTHLSQLLSGDELTLLLGLYAALAVAWYFEGQLRRSTFPFLAMQLCLVGFVIAVRNQILLTTNLWSVERDVWLSLLVSFCLAAMKPKFDSMPREIRISYVGWLLLLPAFAMVWVFAHQMGTDIALVVIGLHSVLFAFMGKDDRESPYHVLAVLGFVTFVILAFWNQFEFRYLHAYTIPVGLGVLVLLQLFKDRMLPDARNRVRLGTLVVMIGSAAYYALLDSRYPLTFHLVLIGLCLASMGLGSFFRIRLYLTIGFAGLMADVASLVYKGMADMERASRMTVVGSLVLLIGLGLVFGALYYKTHEKTLNAHLDRWRKALGAWE